jgi:hypothetical protein
MKASEATVTGYRRPLGYQQISAATLAAATPLTMPTAVPGIAGPGLVIVQCNGGSVRWRDDGVDPTASVGMSIPAGAELDYVGDATKIKFILSAAAPILDVSYYE